MTTVAKVLIMAGGTGGHVFPALTIARELLARGVRVEWLGTRQGIEARVIGATDIPLHFITMSGLRGKTLGRKLLAPFIAAAAVCQAVLRIRRIKPCCVLGLGGFASGPGGVAAWLLGKPLLIHEQNAIAGLTNTLLYPLARVVMEGFAGAFARKVALQPVLRHLVNGRKNEQVGNPVRQNLRHVERGHDVPESGRLHLLVLGGSLGAVAINETVPRMLDMLGPAAQPEVLHQCGERHLDTTLAAYREAGIGLDAHTRVQPFIEDMEQAYLWADLVLCRAGASTVAELCMMGLPAVLVPYPHAVDDHQRGNAEVMVKAGAAVLIPQSELSVAALSELVGALHADRARLRTMGSAALTLARPQAAEHAADLCLEYCRG
ncbi:MAG TPA: undecaprenyldiphospho-muramoylpentapeptide beta-N-acetylglucosaminyltransferase [Hyphomicrobiales bacterium]|nr:undecaprenyldiphospho-muramoylpentapeptide beta-N-acetylglucosaminyltransferase [Hyphomicrobiales bacterium]